MVKTIWKSVVILSAVRATFFILELLLMSLINGLSGAFIVLQERSQEFLNVAVEIAAIAVGLTWIVNRLSSKDNSLSRSQNALATGSATTSATGDSPGVLDADEISSELAEIAVPDDRSESDARNAGTSDRFDNESPNQSTFYDTAPNESLNAKMISEQPETNACSSGEELADILNSAWI